MKSLNHRLFLFSAFAGLAVLTAGCGQSAQSTKASAVEPAASADSQAAVESDLDGSATDADDVAKDDLAPTMTSTGNGMDAIRQAAEADRYLLAFFWKDEDENTVAMRSVFDAAAEDYADRADSVAVKITEPEQKEVIEEFGLDRAPMPIVLAVAPNGAITGGFPTSFAAADFETGFVSAGTTQCVKALQESKLVFLCVQNDKTESNEEAMKGVRDFKTSQPAPEFVEIVKLDPTDSAEADFLKDLQVSSDVKNAVTVMMAPPGVAIGMIEGPTAKEAFVDLLTQAQSGCAAGSCGPSGCGPTQ